MTGKDDRDTMHNYTAFPSVAIGRLTAFGSIVMLLAGCTPSTAPGQSTASQDPVAVAGDQGTAPPPEANCDAEAAASFVGQSATPDLVEAARQAAHAFEVRVIPKDGGATRDFKPDRLNVMLDEAGRIAELRCG